MQHGCDTYIDGTVANSSVLHNQLLLPASAIKCSYDLNSSTTLHCFNSNVSKEPKRDQKAM